MRSGNIGHVWKSFAENIVIEKYISSPHPLWTKSQIFSILERVHFEVFVNIV